MVCHRVRRAGLTLVLSIDGGQTLIGLAAGSSSEEIDWVSCSFVGLYNVLSGVEYHGMAAECQCLVRLQENHVEVVWKRGMLETVFRLSVSEYRNLLRAISDGARSAA